MVCTDEISVQYPSYITLLMFLLLIRFQGIVSNSWFQILDFVSSIVPFLSYISIFQATQFVE